MIDISEFMNEYMTQSSRKFKVENNFAELKDAKKNADKLMQSGTEVNQEQYRKLQREIVASENSMNKLKEEAKSTNSTISKIGDAFFFLFHYKQPFLQ